MATRKGKPPAAGSALTGTKQDESDIIAEIGATPANDENADGELRVEEEKLLEAGAVDAESIRENRRIDQMINAKRGNVPGVQFNIDDIIEKYEVIIKYWPANTLDILVKRLTGTPIQWVIQTRPRSGAELFAAIMERHGRHEEATYSVVVFDTSNKQKRGTGRITVQDTRDTPPTLQPQSQPQGSP